MQPQRAKSQNPAASRRSTAVFRINLLNALERAKARISERPEAGLPAPRPYPALAKAGRRWIIEGSYWISYSLTTPPVISGVFYAMADIPNRL